MALEAIPQHLYWVVVRAGPLQKTDFLFSKLFCSKLTSIFRVTALLHHQTSPEQPGKAGR